jgi:DNA-binding response OmpR family regulator
VDATQSILVVEDDEFIRELMVAILEDEGFAVLAADDAATALRLAEERRPDVILQDLSMPGSTGEKLIAAYRELPNAGSSIVVVSGRTNLETIAQLAGADAFVAKPFDLTQLVDTVRTVLAGRLSADAQRGTSTDGHLRSAADTG